jgi:hypothetical protein
MSTTATTAATKPTTPARPIAQAYEAHVAKKAAHIARRRGVSIPRKHADNTVVEIAGPAKVDHADVDGHTKSDHQGAVGVVVTSYVSEERGERMASVKCEDGQMRAIPESRLRHIGSVGPVGAPASMAPEPAPRPAASPSRAGGRVQVGGGDENYRRNWERLFGTSSKSAS